MFGSQFSDIISTKDGLTTISPRSTGMQLEIPIPPTIEDNFEEVDSNDTDDDSSLTPSELELLEKYSCTPFSSLEPYVAPLFGAAKLQFIRIEDQLRRNYVKSRIAGKKLCNSITRANTRKALQLCLYLYIPNSEQLRMVSLDPIAFSSIIAFQASLRYAVGYFATNRQWTGSVTLVYVKRRISRMVEKMKVATSASMGAQLRVKGYDEHQILDYKCRLESFTRRFISALLIYCLHESHMSLEATLNLILPTITSAVARKISLACKTYTSSSRSALVYDVLTVGLPIVGVQCTPYIAEKLVCLKTKAQDCISRIHGWFRPLKAEGKNRRGMPKVRGFSMEPCGYQIPVNITQEDDTIMIPNIPTEHSLQDAYSLFLLGKMNLADFLMYLGGVKRGVFIHVSRIENKDGEFVQGIYNLSYNTESEVLYVCRTINKALNFPMRRLYQLMKHALDPK
jgi:hypothetical protein